MPRDICVGFTPVSWRYKANEGPIGDRAKRESTSMVMQIVLGSRAYILLERTMWREAYVETRFISGLELLCQSTPTKRHQHQSP